MYILIFKHMTILNFNARARKLPLLKYIKYEYFKTELITT